MLPHEVKLSLGIGKFIVLITKGSAPHPIRRKDLDKYEYVHQVDATTETVISHARYMHETPCEAQGKEAANATAPPHQKEPDAELRQGFPPMTGNRLPPTRLDHRTRSVAIEDSSSRNLDR